MIEAGANFDLIVIGGGINGAGVARDAAGRGLSVLLVEKSDLSSATSSWSSKLIHGGLRYLEQYEFRLVAEALAERETLLNIAQHLVKPMRFVMPHVPALRPRWMIRAGLFLYDHLGHRAKKPAQPDSQLLGSHGIRLNGELYGAGLKSDFTHGFIYSDCRVDDSRLVLTNALSAAEHGAKIMTRTECVAGKRENNAWTLTLRQNNAATITVVAKALVNAAGPWVKTVLNDRLLQPSTDQVRLVKGSHIVVNRCYPGEHAYILQNHDRRVVFMIPYLEHYTLIGTTDVPVNSVADVPEATAEEIQYLCDAVNRYLENPISPENILWSYAGVRPLYDDGSANPSAVTRDYTLRLDDDGGDAPVLSIFGGKITTYRKLAEHVLEKLNPWFPAMKPPWTDQEPLPGSEPSSHSATEPWQSLPPEILGAVFSRHGTRISHVMRGVKAIDDLGLHFGANLYAREIDYMLAHEWATTAEDVLYRRSKAGLLLTTEQKAAVATYIEHRGLRN